MAFHTLLDVRGPSTGGSDFSPGPFAPLMAIQGMVTRTGWDNATWGDTQRISIDDALKVTTLNRAYASHDGSKDPSALACRADLSKIKDIQIVQTVVGGTVAYQE